MHIGDGQIEYLQRIMKLRLSPERVEGLKQDLTAVTDYLGALGGIDATAEQPQSGQPLRNSPTPESMLRDDICTPCTPRNDILSAAPDVREGYIAVPRTVE